MLGVLLEIGVNLLLFGGKPRPKRATVIVISLIVLGSAAAAFIRGATF